MSWVTTAPEFGRQWRRTSFLEDVSAYGAYAPGARRGDRICHFWDMRRHQYYFVLSIKMGMTKCFFLLWSGVATKTAVMEVTYGDDREWINICKRLLIVVFDTFT